MSNRQVELAAAAALGAVSMALALQLLYRQRDEPAQPPAQASFATKKERVVLVTGGRYARECAGLVSIRSITSV